MEERGATQEAGASGSGGWLGYGIIFYICRGEVGDVPLLHIIEHHLGMDAGGWRLAFL
jgi:hypothetical protein